MRTLGALEAAEDKLTARSTDLTVQGAFSLRRC